MSCTLGYNVAKFFTLNGYPKVPLILYVLSEFILAMTIRDNLMLIIWQLIYPSDWIRNWQAELIPLKMDFKSEENDEIEEQGYWLNKYTLPKTSLKYSGEKKKSARQQRHLSACRLKTQIGSIATAVLWSCPMRAVAAVNDRSPPPSFIIAPLRR